MNRKTFIQRTIGAMFIALPAGTLIGCSGSDSGSGNDSPYPDSNPNPDQNAGNDCLSNGTVAAISANHGHTLNVSKADVEAGSQKTYSIQGSSGHNHNVTLSASDFSSLKSNNSITVDSSAGDGHTHSVTVSCA